MYFFKKVSKWVSDNLVGNCCNDCVGYDKCFSGHLEYNKQNTIEHPACKSYKGKKY